MSIRMYRFPIQVDRAPLFGKEVIQGAAIGVDDNVIWAGGEEQIQYHVDRHRRLWVYPIDTRAAVLMEALFPDDAEHIREIAEQMAESRSFIVHQQTREIHDLILYSSTQLGEE